MGNLQRAPQLDTCASTICPCFPSLHITRHLWISFGWSTPTKYHGSGAPDFAGDKYSDLLDARACWSERQNWNHVSWNHVSGGTG